MMRLVDIALHNLHVRRVKMLFLVLGMVVGVATIVALAAINQAMREQVQAQFEALGTKLVVAPYSGQLSLAYSGVTVASAVSFETPELSRADVAVIKDLAQAPFVKVVAPKLLAVTEIDARRYLVAGVDFASEVRLQRHWEFTGRAPASPRDVLLGYQAARRLGKQAGDVLTIRGTALRVAGVLAETGAHEDPLVFMDLSRAEALFDKQGVATFVELVVARPEADRAISEIQRRLPRARITTVKDQGEARREVADRFARLSSLITLIVLGTGVLITSTTMMASVTERTREIGIFRAIGFRRGHIMRVILTEAAIVSAAGGAVGYLGGMGVALLAAPLVAQIQVQVRWNPFFGFGVILLTVVIGLAASLYPATRAARLDPAEALRSI